MRLVADIPHERFKIQVHNYNSKYIVKIELGQFEQTFKVGDTDVMGLQDIKNMLTPELLSNCLSRFVSMRADWENAFLQKNKNNSNLA